MIDLSVSDLVKSFQIGETVLNGVTFHINEGERVGILGKNGSGKTTLFKILTGEYDYDEGQVTLAPGKRIGLISQIPVYPEEYTVEDVLDTAFGRIHAIEEELKTLTDRMAAGESDEELLRRYDRLSSGFEQAGGYDLEVRVNKVCNGLGISQEMRQRPFSALSGGEKTRINLGRLILEDTDILLLDEPTNHLDLHAVEWLEDYVSHFKGTVLTISHDRYFLDRCVDRIIALNEGKAEFYSGNYSFYVVERERRYQERLKQYEKEQAKIAQLTQAVDQMHLWAFMGNDKLHKRAFSMEKRIEKMRTTDKPRQERNLTMGFQSTDFKGDMLFTLEGVSKAYGDHTLFSDLELEVLGGERIALLGDNGTGKSTLLNKLTGAAIPANNRLFDTLDTTTRMLEITDTCTVLISDTVGFIRKLPHHLVEAFKATLEELEYADLLIHVIDASNPEWREQAEVVDGLIRELGAQTTPRLEVFNKSDLYVGEIRPHGENIVSVSAKTGEGLDQMLKMIADRLDTGAKRVELHLPYDQGGVVDTLYREAKVEKVEYADTIQVTAVLTPRLLGQLRPFVYPPLPEHKEDWEQ